MSQKIRITTRANQLSSGNSNTCRLVTSLKMSSHSHDGFCSFTAVRIVTDKERERMGLPQSNLLQLTDRLPPQRAARPN